MAPTAPIPQPRPLPIVGNLPEIDPNAPVQSLMRLARAHGPIYRLSLGGRSLTVVSAQALVNELCDEGRFEKKLHRPLEMLRDLGGDGLFTARNDEPNWGKAHRLLMPAFGPLGIRAMFDRMEDIADQMLLRWERFGPEATIDVADSMTRLTLDTIALCAFDYRFNSFYQNEMHPFVAAMVGALEEAGARARRPEVATNLLLRTKRRYEADIALMHQVADTLIAERRRDPEAATRHDLLNLMLEGRDPETGERLSDENIRYQMVTFLIAGHETTSGLLSFALYLLLRNPDVLQRARDQVDAVLGDGLPRVEDLPRMRYVEQILQETLRLWPTAPAFAVAPKAPTVIGGRYSVTPADTLLILAPILHRDPAVWDDPEAFRPERFAPEAAERLPPNAWKPFGNGMRACIGRGFALQEAHLVLALILRRFDLTEADPGYTLEIAETLTLKPHGFRIHARRRGAARPRSAVPTAPQRPMTAGRTGAPAREATTPLLVLYGSNTGSCQAFAERIAGEAAGQGYAATAAPMDDYVERLPKEGAVIVVTASYEGHPPDNARRFLAWVEGLGPEALAGVRFTVFGCGNRQWARTYQAIPKRTDAALAKAGAQRVRERGETDAGGDFFGGFDAWYAGLWADLGGALGQTSGRGGDQEAAEPAGTGLDVEILRSGRETALHLTDLNPGRILENRELVDTASPLGTSKRHIEIALPAGMSYRTGDYLAVLPRNPHPDVERALRRFGLAGDTRILIRKGAGTATALPAGYPVSAAEILADYVELGQPATRAQVSQLAAATRCPPDRAALEQLAQPEAYAAEVLEKRVSLLDLLERVPACELAFGAFLAALPAMRTRQYSISSSPLRDPARCSLTLSVLDAPARAGGRRHRGVASTYLAGLEPGARLSVAVRPSQAAFHPPEDPAVPIVMICAGSGIAPFHGFLQERAIQKANGRPVGPALLFFGATHPDVDYLYRDELAAWEAQGVVSVRTAFSQAPDGDVRYVQHRVWRDRADVADLFRAGATVFVCGDGERMAPAVRATCVRIYQEARAVTPEEAEAWADTVERETGRYVADVFA
ncbi:bifunctional cytochrome P450/NADPH--P450 reductase [Methylobacterium brachiatum]|uniref:bifunctional cytochrome P450/NADPH--P450 reductase n=1 Tax=Methylobacterium brachiatum TaxID=269660 RepID=UPI0008EE6ABA|nr:cytochrome P450 [Methylobacterium brachiatum]SFI46140.1 cytochrome P450 / NADPH-cytochrome P450 reductase [Methylobacterium brachiatum]